MSAEAALSPEMAAALQQQVAMVAAMDPMQQAGAQLAVPEAGAADPNSLAALSALGMVPGMVPGVAAGGLTAGLTAVPGVDMTAMSAMLNPEYAAAAQAAAANAYALYYQALSGLGLSTAALTGTTLDTTTSGLGTSRPNFETKPGDWNCKACGDLQFARNTKCRRCGADKPSEAELAAAPPPRPNLAPDGRPMRPGDWMCPICGDHVFARNARCRKCGQPRANSDPRQQQIAREGDWNCKMCGDLQFARNAACRRCGAEKPTDAGLKTAVSAATTTTPAARTGGGDLRPGDWMCPKCHDHVFARNEHCRRCGTTRPTGADLAAMAAAGTLPPAGGRRDRSRSPRPEGRRAGVVAGVSAVACTNR